MCKLGFIGVFALTLCDCFVHLFKGGARAAQGFPEANEMSFGGFRRERKKRHFRFALSNFAASSKTAFLRSKMES